MKRAVRGSSRGYTILETMIFLAVSAGLFISAMAFIDGRQSRTEFSSAVRSFESAINDAANDVSDGYFQNGAGGQLISSCSATATSITISGGTTDNQGSKKDCILIGKAIQFAPSGSSGEDFSLINLVGRHYKNASMDYGDVQSYADSGVKAVAPASPSDTTPNSTSSSTVGYGVTIDCVLYLDPATPVATPNDPQPCNTSGANVQKVDTIAFMTKLHGLDINGEDQTGNTSVDLLVSKFPTNAEKGLDRTTQDTAATLNGFSAASNVTTNPAGGIYICLQSHGTNQYALVKMGGSTSSFTALSTIKDGKCK